MCVLHASSSSSSSSSSYYADRSPCRALSQTSNNPRCGEPPCQCTVYFCSLAWSGLASQASMGRVYFEARSFPNKRHTDSPHPRGCDSSSSVVGGGTSTAEVRTIVHVVVVMVVVVVVVVVV